MLMKRRSLDIFLYLFGWVALFSSFFCLFNFIFHCFKNLYCRLLEIAIWLVKKEFNLHLIIVRNS